MVSGNPGPSGFQGAGRRLSNGKYEDLAIGHRDSTWFALPVGGVGLAVLECRLRAHSFDEAQCKAPLVAGVH